MCTHKIIIILVSNVPFFIAISISLSLSGSSSLCECVFRQFSNFLSVQKIFFIYKLNVVQVVLKHTTPYISHILYIFRGHTQWHNQRVGVARYITGTHIHMKITKKKSMTICSQHIQIQIYLIQVSRHGLYECETSTSRNFQSHNTLLCTMKSLTNNRMQQAYERTHMYARQPFFQLFYLQ